MYSALSTLNTTTEVPLSKSPNPQLLPGRRSIDGCTLLRVCVCPLCVCVHCVCAIQSTNSEYGSPYFAVCHVTFIRVILLIFLYSVFIYILVKVLVTFYQCVLAIFFFFFFHCFY